MRNPLAILLLATAAQAAPHYTRVLLPVYFEQSIPGAFGSVWESRFTVHNDARISYVIDNCSPVGPIGDPGCLLFLAADEDIRPSETQTALPNRYPKPANGVAGAVVYLYPDIVAGPEDPNGLSFQLRIRDISRSSTSAGTEIPVLRESAFRTATVRLLDVPTDARFRSVVRLFEMDLDHAEFTVRILDETTNTLLSEQRVTTSTPPQGPLRFHPGFVQIAVPAAPLETSPAYVRVEIEPLTAGSAFWAYVSITNNDSQQVTLVTPQ